MCHASSRAKKLGSRRPPLRCGPTGASRPNRRLSDHRIDEYRKAITTAEANGDAEGARVFRRMMLGEEQDRQSIDGMIDGLRLRFSRRVPAATR